ncbi:protocadherin Fat 4-like [Anopheles ziemanni]|uniref:protocadherin Fat 4-like n=1 Tax=Anopheles coustani TaxID=139045 RepID=UPI0026590A00|nr:protocadherin Fat 4-like [Anopheles coustani]XP_058178630.1 protocadherin Fat 4-like [Anopheles ziemanni]
MWLYVLLLGCCWQLQATQGCSSPSYNFNSHVNPEELDLTTPTDTVIASFTVADVTAVSLVPEPIYIDVRLVGSELQFLTTAKFADYEENETQIVLILQLSYTCSTTQRSGLYRQNFKKANNHAPRFLQDAYEALVPLPLPKNFDVSPYLASGTGIMARDIDLINNTVQFTISENEYFNIETHPLAEDEKQFKAVLRLREQVLKLANTVQLIVTATDQGIPPKASQVSVSIQPDLSIVYDDPPEFKDTFVNRTMDPGTIIQLELIPGTETNDIQYTLEGIDREYFTLSVWANNSGLDLQLVNLDTLPSTKSFLNVLAVAKRSELQKTSSVILLTIPSASNPEPAEITVQKVLVVLHLEEMAAHRNIFPLTIENCVFSIGSQTPGEYFYVEKSNNTLSSEPFDREDENLFSGLDFPQFWIVLMLNCPALEDQESQSLNGNLMRSGPMRDIAYSSKQTHLNIIVQDINDNSPEFIYPSNNAIFAFPSARLARKLLPERLLKVEASDRDEGINAIIRYRLAANDHFDIEAETGVIFPLKTSLADETSTTLEVYATDRDGAEDGNTASLKIKVLRGSEDRFVAVTVHGVNPLAFESLLQNISDSKNIVVGAIKIVYSAAGDANDSGRAASERYATQALVYAVQGDALLSYSEVADILNKLQYNLTISLSTLNELFTSPSTTSESDSTIIYPYIIVAAFFGCLALSMTAAAIFYRAKSRQNQTTAVMSETTSINSGTHIIANMDNDPYATPPRERDAVQTMDNGIASESTEIFKSAAPMVHPKSHTELRSIDENSELHVDPTEPPQSAQHDQKKSITFNEHVERIEMFDA